MMSALIALLRALPEVISLIKTIQARQREKEVQSKIKEDLKKIDEAFKNEDAEALNKLFNS